MAASTVSPSAPITRSSLKVALAFAVIYIAWGATFVAIRVVVADIPPFLAAAVRFFTAGVLLYVFMRLRGAPRPAKSEWRTLALLGTLVIFFDYAIYFWGEKYVAAGTAAVIAATIPLITGLLEMFVFRQQPFRRSKAGAIMLGFVGVSILLSGQIKAGQPLLPCLAMIGATTAWSLGMVLTRSMKMPDSRAIAAGGEMIIGGAMLLVLAAVTGEMHSVPHLTWKPVVAMLYLIFIGSLLAFTAFVWLLGRVSAGQVASHAFVNPVVAVLLGAWLLHEAITGCALIGMALVIVSVVLVLRRERLRQLAD